MKVNLLKTKVLKSPNFFYYCILGLVVILFLIFLGWQLNSFYQEMDKLDSGVTVLVHSSQETDFQLFIEGLNISAAPIILDVDGSNEKEYFKALEGGVAHYKGTAYPGKKGNSFIFGHSEYYQDKPGDYKEIFKNLDLLEVGDEIIIRSEKREYKYSVLKIEIIGPKDVEVLEQTQDFHLTLMTCWPPGSIAKRLIVIAQKI